MLPRVAGVLVAIPLLEPLEVERAPLACSRWAQAERVVLTVSMAQQVWSWLAWVAVMVPWEKSKPGLQELKA
jgi:hypothetical protein